MRRGEHSEGYFEASHSMRDAPHVRRAVHSRSRRAGPARRRIVAWHARSNPSKYSKVQNAILWDLMLCPREIGFAISDSDPETVTQAAAPASPSASSDETAAPASESLHLATGTKANNDFNQMEIVQTEQAKDAPGPPPQAALGFFGAILGVSWIESHLL